MLTTTKHFACRCRYGSCAALALLTIASLLVLMAIVPAPADAVPPDRIRIVMDDNYPPYAFKDGQGRLQGIIVDQWQLWAKKTGIRVELTGMDWADAQRRMEAGEFDVIDTIFHNEKRELIYDFTKPYARIDVPLYFHADISGIRGPADVMGFQVGAKAGGNVLSFLNKQGVTNIAEYPSYENIIEAAAAGKLKVFTVDKPPALYFMHKLGISSQFRETVPMYSGEFHRAVAKGNRELLALLEKGFDQITPAEYAAIDRVWLGSPIGSPMTARYFFVPLVGAGILLLLLLCWLWLLKRAVRSKTAALEAEITVRAEKEQALAASELRYRTVIEQIQDVIYQADAAGRLTMQSPSGAILLGYASVEEMLGCDIKNTFYYDPTERDRFLEVLRSSGSVSSYPITLKRKDGTPVQVSTSTHLRYDETGNYCGVEGVFRDITEQVAAEQALRASEAKFLAAFEHAPLLMSISVPETGQYLAVNQIFCTVSGFTADEMIGKTSIELGWISAADRERIKRELRENGRVKSLDLTLTAKDGRTVYCDFRAELITVNGEQRLLSIALDVTDQRMAKEALVQSEERYRELVEQSAAWLWETDATIRHIYSNNHVESLLGYPVHEFMAMDLFALLHPDDHETVKEIVRRAIQDRQGWRGIVLRWKHRDGSWRHIQSSGIPQFDAQGTFLGLHGVDIDVTDRMKLEEEQERNQRLESLGLLAGGIAHDFNNILTGIVGNISLARMLIEPDNKAQQRLQQSEKACQRAVNLTRQLLTFARGGEPVKQKTDVIRLLRESAEFSLRGSGISFDLAPPTEPWTVEADEGQLTQVFNNLLINATHAMPDGGQVALRVANCHLGKSACGTLPAGNYVRISIIDQGSGIALEHLDKIFDPYFTTKAHGTGLGLTAAYSIIKKHGGLLTATSDVGKGSCFEILLPAQPEKAPPPPPEMALAVPAGKGRILVMDDEESLREVVVEILAALGYAAVCCANGTEAIDRYQEALASGNRFTAVILDLTVPGGMGGKEAAKKLRSMDPAAVLIAASGYSNDPVMADYRAFDFDGTVAKPFQVAQLAEAIQRAITADGPRSP